MAYNTKKTDVKTYAMAGLAVVAVAAAYLFFTEKGKALKTTLLSFFTKKP